MSSFMCFYKTVFIIWLVYERKYSRTRTKAKAAKLEPR